VLHVSCQVTQLHFLVFTSKWTKNAFGGRSLSKPGKAGEVSPPPTAKSCERTSGCCMLIFNPLRSSMSCPSSRSKSSSKYHLFRCCYEPAIAAVCFGERIGTFDATGGDSTVAARNDDARQLSAAISETFVCFRATMFNFPWYRYFRTPTYQRFERAANAMRQ